jgi:hypothetical protein
MSLAVLYSLHRHVGSHTGHLSTSVKFPLQEEFLEVETVL